MTTEELTDDLEETIVAHDLNDDQAARVRELVDEGVLLFDAIRQAKEEEPRERPAAPAPGDPASGLEEPTEAMIKAVVRENERHEKSVRKIMGGFVEGFGACSHCDGLGLEEPGPKPQTHAFFAACATCAGYGEVLTGSLDAQHRGVKCPDCAGRGYLELLVDNTPAVELVERWREERRRQAIAPAPIVPETQAPGVGGTLTMGRPAWMGDPELGK